MSSIAPSSISVASTFDETQFALPYPPGIERHFWTAARNRIIERQVRKIVRMQVPRHLEVLDVGCGPGVVVGHLRAGGVACRGVELGHPVVRPGLERHIDIGTDATTLPATSRDRVGTILLLDVIEHIEQPTTFLEGLLSAFPALTHVLITVPARQELWSNYDTYYGHYRRYDLAALQTLASRCGLDVVTLKYMFRALYPVMRTMVHRAGERPVEIRPPAGILATALHRAMALAFEIEERLPLAGVIPGTSVLAVLSRRT